MMPTASLIQQKINLTERYSYLEQSVVLDPEGGSFRLRNIPTSRYSDAA